MCKIILRYYLYIMVFFMYGEDKNSHTYSLTIQINVNLPKKTPRGLALGKRDNTVCLQEHNKIFFLPCRKPA